MLYYALLFLLVGLVAGALGLFGVAAIASQIAWVLFLIGIILIVVHLVTGRGLRAPCRDPADERIDSGGPTDPVGRRASAAQPAASRPRRLPDGIRVDPFLV